MKNIGPTRNYRLLSVAEMRSSENRKKKKCPEDKNVMVHFPSNGQNVSKVRSSYGLSGLYSLIPHRRKAMSHLTRRPMYSEIVYSQRELI